MKLSFKSRIWRISSLLFAGFVILFTLRLIYGYTSKSRGTNSELHSGFFNNFSNSKKNYASDRYKYEKGSKAGDNVSVKAIDVNQKYEKTATLQATTAKFEQEEKKLKGFIRNFNGIVQYEEATGNKGRRALYLLIGIQPEKFDSFYTEIKKVGDIKSADIIKVDKTSEYKKLNAKKASLEKIREALIELKEQGGKIEEYIDLQNRILEIEEELQELGVDLGDFSEENEFCTVKFSLMEGSAVSISLLHRLKVAFEWTVKYYLMFVMILALCSFTAFFILLILEKLKVFSGIVSKLNQ